MDYLGIPLLAWDEYLRDQPIASTYRDLNCLTTKKICLHSRLLAGKCPKPFHYATREAHHIFIDKPSPWVTATIVHELLHGILIEEGYTRVTGRLGTSALETLSNELQHIEIFRRMREVYRVAEPRYWLDWQNQICTAAGWAAEDSVQDPFRVYIEFPRVFSWYFFVEVTGPGLNKYRIVNPRLCDAAFEAAEEAKTTGFTSPEANTLSLGIFNDHWARFCERILPRNEHGMNLLGRVKECHPKLISAFVNDRDREKIFEHLGPLGLVRPQT